MPRFSRLSFAILVGLSGTALTLGAQSTDEKEDTPKSNQRVISKNVAAALAASMPKYNPPKKEEKKMVDNRDMRDVDKPRNKIIRLPEFVVRQDKPPVFRESEIYTKAGLKQLALKRYFSETSLALNPSIIPVFEKLAEAYALMLYQQDERLENISELNETANGIERVDPENAEDIRKATRDTYRRTYDGDNTKYD